MTTNRRKKKVSTQKIMIWIAWFFGALFFILMLAQKFGLVPTADELLTEQTNVARTAAVEERQATASARVNVQITLPPITATDTP
jgi:hypothetical protein